jgi:pyrimidine operon attenuation protein/uracil phosphoribosyltransferase
VKNALRLVSPELTGFQCDCNALGLEPLRGTRAAMTISDKDVTVDDAHVDGRKVRTALHRARVRAALDGIRSGEVVN